MKEWVSKKILNIADVKRKCYSLKIRNRKVVFTNGCFDIIHKGHLDYLFKARNLGDFLVVGLNSDASVKKLKGESRPIKDEQTRALLLASLSFVDAVVIFESETPLELIKNISPNILVKGGDYKIEDIVGYDFVKKNNGLTTTIPFVEGHSSTALIEKIKN